MSLSTATISYDISDLVGADFDSRRTKVWVTTNVPDDTIVDTVGNAIRVGDGLGSVAEDGTGSVAVWVPGTGSNPASWQTTVHLDYAPRRPGAARLQRAFGPFTVSASANLADLIEEQEVPPDYLSQVSGALQDFVDDAEAAQAAAEAAAAAAVDISGISTSDGVVSALVEGTGGVGPLTRAAITSMIEPPLNPLLPQYGVLADGSTNDSTAWQTVANAIPAIGGDVWIPAGVSVASNVTWPNRVRLIGRGVGASELHSPHASQPVFILQGSNSHVSDISIGGTATTPAAGQSAIKVQADYVSIDKVALVNFYDLLDFESGHGWVVSRGYLVDARRYGIRVRNTANVDAGDATLLATTIDTSYAASGGVRQESGGGMKVVGLKVLNHAIGLDLAVPDGVATSILIVSASSFESQTTACLSAARSGTTGVFGEVMIGDDVQMTADQAPVAVVIGAGISRTKVAMMVKGNPASTVGVHYTGGDGHFVNGAQFYNCLTGVKADSISGLNIGTNHHYGVTNHFIATLGSFAVWPIVAEHHYRRDVGNITSTSTYTNMYQVGVAGFQGAELEVSVSGLLQGVGAVQSRHRYGLTSTGTVTATPDDSLVAGAAIDVQLDTATTAGSVLVGLRRNAGAGGSAFNGSIEIRVKGAVTKVARL